MYGGTLNLGPSVRVQCPSSKHQVFFPSPLATLVWPNPTDPYKYEEKSEVFLLTLYGLLQFASQLNGENLVGKAVGNSGEDLIIVNRM